jgi:MFS family permease
MDEKDFQPRAADSPGDATPPASCFNATKEVLRSPFLRTVVAVCAVGNFCFQIVVLSLVVLAEQQHMSGAKIGLLMATSGACGLAGSVVAPLLKTRVQDERNIVTFCVIAWTGLTCVVAVFAQPVVGLIAWGGLIVTGGFLNVAMNIHQVVRVPGAILGRVMGINRFLTSGAMPLGAVCAGYIVAKLHPQAAAWLACGVMVSMIVISQILLRPRKVVPGRVVDWMREQLAPKMVATAVPAVEEIHEPTLEPVPVAEGLLHVTHEIAGARDTSHVRVPIDLRR